MPRFNLSKLRHNPLCGLRPHALALAKPSIELPALADAFSNRAGGFPDQGSDGLKFGDEVLRCVHVGIVM